MTAKLTTTRIHRGILAIVILAVVGVGIHFGGFGRAAQLPGDVNNDGIVNITDLSLLLSQWSTANPNADFNNDHIVNVFDLSALLSHWGNVNQGSPTPTAIPQVNWLPCTTSHATGDSSTRAVVAVGVTANDTQDDFQALQAAINFASSGGGGVITLKPGIYIIDGHLQMKSNVTLQGVGPATVLKAGPNFMSTSGSGGGYPVITTKGANNVTLANFTADQGGDVLNGNVGNRLDSNLIDIDGSTNVVVSGVYARNSFTHSFAASHGATRFCFLSNNTSVTTQGKYGQLDGVHIIDSSVGDVKDNVIDQRVGTDGGDGLAILAVTGSVHDVAVEGNRVRGGHNGSGMQLAVSNFDVYNLIIKSNEFYGAPYGIRTGYYGTATGAVHDLSITNNYIHDLVVGASFPTLGDAINIGGFGAKGPVTNIAVTDNKACNAGTITITPATGGVITGTTGC